MRGLGQAIAPIMIPSARLMLEGGWKWLTFLGMAFALATVVAALVAGYLISREKRFEREGETATATIHKKDSYTSTSGRSRRTKRHYRIFYTFAAPEGKTRQGKGELSRGRWQKLEPGDKIEIQHLPSDPSQNRLVGSETGKMVWLVLLFPFGFGVASLIILGLVGRRAARHARLLANGVLTRGVVEEKRERRDITINNRHPYSVRYRFDLPTGESQTGKDLVTDLAFASKLAPDQPVGVIYLPEDPAKCTLFRDKWLRHFESGGM